MRERLVFDVTPIGKPRAKGTLIDKSGRRLTEKARARMGGATRFVPKHGMRNSVEYHTWLSMRARCESAKSGSYRTHGARGIKVCERWRDFRSFFADMGRRPAGMSLDRIDNDGDYKPQNCRWASLKEQNRNKRTTSWVEYQGKRMSVAELAEIVGMKRDTIAHRLRRGIPLARAIIPTRTSYEIRV